ncbi:MAG: chemotaxis protein CheX [Phycisphaerae bacterium]
MFPGIATNTVDLSDALRAVAVNSAYNSSRALSKWLKRGVRLRSDGFVKSSITELGELVGAADSAVAAIHMPLGGDIQGNVLLAFPEEVAMKLIDMMLDQAEGTTTTFGEMEQSCLQETGNIVGTSFANSLAQWLNISVAPLAPCFAHDLACAVVQPLVVNGAMNGDDAWLAKTEFELDGHRQEWALILLLAPESLALVEKQCNTDNVRQNAMHAIAVNAAFNASRAISKWLKRGVRLTTDGFTRMPLKELSKGSTEPSVALHMELTQQLHGHLLLVFSMPTARTLSSLLMQTELGEGLDEMAQSALCETANIIGTSFTNSIAKWLELQTAPSVPELRIDLADALFEGLVAEQAALSDTVLMAKSVFSIDGQWLEADLYLLPTPASFRLLEATVS